MNIGDSGLAVGSGGEGTENRGQEGAAQSFYRPGATAAALLFTVKIPPSLRPGPRGCTSPPRAPTVAPPEVAAPRGCGDKDRSGTGDADGITLGIWRVSSSSRHFTFIGSSSQMAPSWGRLLLSAPRCVVPLARLQDEGGLFEPRTAVCSVSTSSAPGAACSLAASDLPYSLVANRGRDCQSHGALGSSPTAAAWHQQFAEHTRHVRDGGGGAAWHQDRVW